MSCSNAALSAARRRLAIVDERVAMCAQYARKTSPGVRSVRYGVDPGEWLSGRISLGEYLGEYLGGPSVRFSPTKTHET